MATARRILLDGLARDTEVAELAGELVPLHPRDNTFPGEVLLQVAADALDWCGASRADPLSLEQMRERFLPEYAFRGRQNKKLQFAILAAAALRGGTEPDLLDEVAWLSRLRPGEQFAYVFDLGDDWAHLCTVGAQRIDPVEVLGIQPDAPLPYWGWGDIPDQYRRRWDGDDGESPPPRNPGLADLPPLRPHWGPGIRRQRHRFTAL